MKAGGKAYGFSYTLLGVSCQNARRCSDPAGYAQEEAVGKYVARTTGKLAPGSLEK
jgi:hypothetical protein